MIYIFLITFGIITITYFIPNKNKAVKLLRIIIHLVCLGSALYLKYYGSSILVILQLIRVCLLKPTNDDNAIN